MSSTKRLIKPFKIMVDGDMSDDITGTSTVCENQDNLLYHISWSGTAPVGVLKFEAVSKQSENPALKEWFDVNFGTTIDITGNSGEHTVVFNTLPFFELRPVYICTSGVGNLNILVMAKEG